MEVKELRRALGLTQAEFADLLGVTQPAVSAWESGKRGPAALGAFMIERFLHTFEGRTRVYGEFRGRPIELPDERWNPVIKPDRIVTLPNRLDWSPRLGGRDLRDDDQRAGMYAQVLDVGAPCDIRFWIDPESLAALWPDVPVARHMEGPVAEMLAAL